MEFVLSCCSTADRSPTFFEERRIVYAPFHFHMDGEDYLDDLGSSMPFEEFYRRMKNGAEPVTSQVNGEEFIALWEPHLQEGRDILHVSLSSGLSGVINSANMAMRELQERYPERTIRVVDSLGASSGYGLLMEYLADMRDSGATLEEVYRFAEEKKRHLHHWFFSTDLSSYKRGGRISATSAAVGTLLGICPLLNMDDEGRLIPRKKLRGKRRAIEAMVEQMALHAEDGAAYSGKCALCHSDCAEDAEAVAALVEMRFPQLKGRISVNSVGTVIGSHTGPGTVALFFMGDQRKA